MYVIGDTHSIRPVFEIIDRKKLNGQNLIHVGDFGLGFQEVGRDIKNLLLLDEALMDTDNQLYVIRGNHDNPIFWDKSKGLNLPIFHNLHLVDDYTIINIEGQNVLFVGGAMSIDRRPRMIDIPPTWWKDEVFVMDYQKLKRLRDIDIDIVITHTAPDFCHPKEARGVDIVDHYAKIEMQHGKDLYKELEEERANVTELYNELVLIHKVLPKKWYYGHFHASKKRNYNGTEFILLDINEIQEINL